MSEQAIMMEDDSQNLAHTTMFIFLTLHWFILFCHNCEIKLLQKSYGQSSDTLKVR